MDDWKLYVKRGILSSDGDFDSSQIKVGLDIELLPQIVLPIDTKVDDGVLFDALYGYLLDEGLSNLSLEITGHDKKPFNFENSQKIMTLVDKIYDFNEAFGETIIKDVISTAGAVHSIPEELALREQSEFNKYEGVDATFTAKEYNYELGAIKANMLNISKDASMKGIQLIIENSACIDYGFTDDIGSKSEILNSDSRWGKTGWLPKRLQTGDVGCAEDLDFFTNLKRSVSINVGDLIQTAEYSGMYNRNNMGLVENSNDERGILNNSHFGVFVKQGNPICYEKKIDPIDIIKQQAGRISSCVIDGQISMFYEDVGVTKIGSHMPLTFGDDPNPYIISDDVRLEQNKLREEIVFDYLKALHGAGCRKGVLNLYLGPGEYTGPKWQKYHKISRDNILSIINNF